MGAQEVFGILLILTALSSYINYRVVKLPKSTGLTLITLVLSLAVAAMSNFGWQVDGFAHEFLNAIGFNDAFLHWMLGFLLFANSLHINSMELAKHKTIVALLATVSVIISTVFIGFGMYSLTKLLAINIPLAYCLLFGALISPTDPIATLSILKIAKAPKSLELKIAGESLFNDGMGIVLFFMMLGMAEGNESAMELKSGILFFLQQGIGGLALGAAIGWGASRLLRDIDNYEVAIILTLAVVGGGYTFAEHVVHVSGAISMALAGLIIGSLLRDGKMSKETMHKLEAFWELVDEMLNAILFVLIGMEFLRLHYSAVTILASCGAVIITIAARWVSVALPIVSMSTFRKFSPSMVLVMTWGGIRGGISIALALTTPTGPMRDFILSVTYAVVLFSIMVQGLTMRRFIGTILKTDTEPTFNPSDYDLEIVHRPENRSYEAVGSVKS